jgi:hypothetical protein
MLWWRIHSLPFALGLIPTLRRVIFCFFNLLLVYQNKDKTNMRELLQRHDKDVLVVVDSPEVGTNVRGLF